ncbi:hypothetical protein DFH09DRAFT_1094525 [Mycena vulgaris]|nr:hypothetical protein DFH09DRAFT_1094525 [Mycena vulgaris]
MPTFLELSCLPPSFLVSIPLAQPATCSLRMLAPLDLSLFPMHYLLPPSGPSATGIPTPHAPIGPSPSYVYPAAAPYYPLLSFNMAAPSHLAPPSYYPLARSQYSTSSYYPPSSTSSSNVNVTDFVQLSYIQLLVFVAADAYSPSVHPLQDTLREHHLRARWRHPMLPNPKLKLNLNLNLNLDLNTLLVILLTRHSCLSPPNHIIVFSVLETRPVWPQTCLLVRSRLKKILTVDAEIEIHVMFPSEGALTKLREALLVGRAITCNAALQHIDLPSKAIRMDDRCYSLLCGRITVLRAQLHMSIRGGEMFLSKDCEVEWMGTETNNGRLEPAYPENYTGDIEMCALQNGCPCRQWSSDVATRDVPNNSIETIERCYSLLSSSIHVFRPRDIPRKGVDYVFDVFGGGCAMCL